MADIFISYAREDASAVEKLAAALESAGYSVWWDRNLATGARYLEATEAELKVAKAVIVLWTRTSITSHWVADEAGMGRDAGRLVPISTDGSMPPLGFRQFQVTDFSHWKGGADEAPFRSLVSALARLAPHGEATSTPKTPAAKGRIFQAMDWLSRRPLAIAGIVLPLFLVVAGLALLSTRGGSAQAQVYKSIAVLPFEDMSAARDQEYFADGMAEELLNLLARNRELRVSARTSSFAFKGKDRTIADIAKELGVEVVLEGSVRKDGEKMRITAQLVEARSGFHLWSDTYNSTLGDDLFTVQDQISAAIAQQLQATMGGKPPTVLARTDNPEANSAYLAGNQFLDKGDTASLEKAKQFYQKAIDADPNFAPAYAKLAMAINGQTSRTTDIFDRMNELINQAKTINSGLPEVWWAQATLSFTRGDIEGQRDATERLRKIDPNSTLGLVARMQTLVLDEKYSEAAALIGQLTQADPFGVDATLAVASVLSITGKAKDAVARISKAMEYHPDLNALRVGLARSMEEAGDRKGAIDIYLGILDVTPEDDIARNEIGLMLISCALPDEAAAMSVGAFGRERNRQWAGGQANLASLNKELRVRLPPISRGIIFMLDGNLRDALPLLEETYRGQPRLPVTGARRIGYPRPWLLAARRAYGPRQAADDLERDLVERLADAKRNGWADSWFWVYSLDLAAARGRAKEFFDIAGEMRENGTLAKISRNWVIFDGLRSEPQFKAFEGDLAVASKERRDVLEAGGQLKRIRALIKKNGWDKTK